VRGGTSHCQVILSSEEIASPVSERFDSMIILNGASAERFIPRAEEQTLILLNRSMCDVPAGFTGFTVDATREAGRLGSPRAANFVMLGAFLREKEVVPVSRVEREIERFFLSKGKGLADLNVRALHLGLDGKAGV